MKNQKTNSSDKKAKRKTLKKKDADFFIVGIGASAGGIKALKEFFKEVPADTGMAFVVILHLSPDFESNLAEILQTSAKIPATQVKRKVLVEPNHIYVIPPNKSLSTIGGYLSLSAIKRVEERRAPVDIFFRTLAQSHQSRAVAVLLSGTGSNGSMGIKHIKGHGGICIVQDPKEAEYSEMPQHSIATGLVDNILPVAEIPAKVIGYKNNFGQVQIPHETEKKSELDEKSLLEIFTLLRVRTKHDFINYKRATVLRRLERRINVNQLKSLKAYANFLREHKEETQILLRDLLISVTNFFRDTEAFESLEREIIPKLFENKKSEDQIRIWTAGCATGEEAYSLAMLLREYAERLNDTPKIQIFATDIDEAGISKAREALYSKSDVADVSSERLGRFFIKEQKGFRITKEIREMVLFALHNVIKDPPFSRLDLITCRNLLIYMNSNAQSRLMETFHFALNPGGFLFLGSSESGTEMSNLYTKFDKKQNIFKSRPVETRLPITVSESQFLLSPVENKKPQNTREAMAIERLSYMDIHQRLLETYAPPSVVINENYDIVHFSERAGSFMQLAGGEPTYNLLKVVRPEFRIELRTALYQAIQKGINVSTNSISAKIEAKTKVVKISVCPVMRPSDATHGLILVVFEETDEPTKIAVLENILANEPIAQKLEDELIQVKKQLRSTIEQYEIQTEESKASNEELQSMNEELHSTAEELETSKEELQSVNEELLTVNQELKIKIEELSQANNDFQNLMASTDIGTLFLDRSLSVKFFTPRLNDIFNLIPSDIGRPLTDITSSVKNADLLADVKEVLEKLQTITRELETTNGKWYLMEIIPYRTKEDRIEGVIVTFVEITERILREFELKNKTDSALRDKKMLRKLVSTQEDERRRISRDLHDHLGQQLTVLRLNLDFLEELQSDEKSLKKKLEETREIAKNIDNDIDFLAWELRPAMLNETSLRMALANYVKDWSNQTEISADFQSSSLPKARLIRETETSLYRIAQESLNNIYKHAQAKNISVILEKRDKKIVLVVEDDGIGFDYENTIEKSEGLGLMGMRERAEICGGTLEVESSKGKGTTIFVRVPIRFLKDS